MACTETDMQSRQSVMYGFGFCPANDGQLALQLLILSSLYELRTLLQNSVHMQVSFFQSGCPHSLYKVLSCMVITYKC